MFDALLAHPGVREELVLRSSIGLMAYHGGNLEAMTDVIASEVAERSGASYYGVIQPPDLRWHVPSHEVTPERSERLTTFFEHVEVVITVHGYGREGFWTRLLLGGTNRELARHVAGYLEQALPEYEHVTELEHIPKELRGLHHANPANLARQGGVQLELPPRVRGRSPIWKDWKGPGHVPHTTSLISALSDAVTAWDP